MEHKREIYSEVWGDRVILKELFRACLLGIFLTMLFYLSSKNIISKKEGLDAELVNGYALIFGVFGCLISGLISTKKFKPKRIVQEQYEIENIEDILKSAGISLDEEIKNISEVDKDIIKELENLKLYALLSLIPKDSKNYKEEYKEIFEEMKNGN